MGNTPIREVIIFGDDYWKFYKKQTTKVKQRIDWTLKVIQEIDHVPKKYLKHLTGTDLYEVRVSSGNNIFRIFCFFDKGKLVVLLNAFQKKTQKTPRKEINKAVKLKDLYYDQKG
jgi:phage-related protein